MDLTATRTRRICNLPLLLQVQKLHKNTTWTRRIYNLSLLLQVKKKNMQSLYSANHQQYLTGHRFLLSFINRGVRLLLDVVFWLCGSFYNS